MAITDEKQVARILDAKTKGLSLREIALREGTTIHQIRETVKSPAILREIAEHRTKYAITSYQSACIATEIIAESLKGLKGRDLSNDIGTLRALAVIAKSQFEQSNALLAGVIKDVDRTADSELDEAAKLLAAKVLRREAEAAQPTVEAEEYTDVEFSGPREAGNTGGEQEVGSDPPGMGG